MIKVVVTILLIFVNMRFFGPIIGFVSSSFFVFLSRFKYLFYKYKPEKIDGKEIIIKFGIPVILTRLSTLVFINAQSLILAFFYTPEVVGIFGIAMIIASQISILPNIFSGALFPIMSLLSTKKDAIKKQSQLTLLVFRYSFMVLLPMIIFISLFSDRLILLISQSSYLPATSLIPILAFGSLFLSMSNILLYSFYASGRPEVQRNLSIFTTIFYLITAFPLVYMFSALGSSLAYAISTIFLFISSFFYAQKILHFRMPWKTIIQLLVANIISFILLFALSKFAPNIFVGALYTILVGVFYLFLLLFIRFYTSEDLEVLDIFANRLPIGSEFIRKISKLVSKFINH